MPAGTEGFLKLHRKIKDSAIYHAPAKCRLLFFEILLHATWEENDYTFIGTKKVQLNRGDWITTYGDLAEKIDSSKSTCKRYLETMKDADMVRTQSETHGKYRKTRISVVNWDKYQESENENENVERKTATENEREVTSQSEHQTERETERGTEQQCTKEVKKKRSKEDNNKEKSEDVPGPTPNEFMYYWNKVMPDEHSIRYMTEKRKSKLRTRRSEDAFVDNWKSVIDKASNSDFLMNECRPFDATWVLKNDDNYVKIIEGKYDDSGKDGEQNVKPGQSSANLQRVK